MFSCQAYLGDEDGERCEGAASGADDLHKLVQLHDPRQVRLKISRQCPAADREECGMGGHDGAAGFETGMQQEGETNAHMRCT